MSERSIRATGSTERHFDAAGRGQPARRVVACAVLSALLLLGSTGRADGLLLRPIDIPAAARAALAQQIAADKRAHPRAYLALGRLQGHRPEIYRQRRNPVPGVDRELRRLGQPALLPMLEALAWRAPSHQGVDARGWRALQVGMLRAVGRLRDRRSAPVLRAVFARTRQPELARAAAEALGAQCDAPALTALERALGGADRARRRAAVWGLGQCRRLPAAEQLAAALEATTDRDEAATIAHALGTLGSSWAWRALGPARGAEGRQARRLAAEALVRGYLRFAGPAVRAAHRFGLAMVAHPDTPAMVQRLAAGADAPTRRALQAIAARAARGGR